MTRPIAVVVVDDQRSFRVAAAAVTEMTDGFVFAAGADSGESAIELLDHLDAEIVLMDVNMPGIGGLRAAENLRARDPGTLIVLVSTYDAADLPAAVRQSGMPYMSKQRLTPESLAAAWDQHIDARST
jgi:two-component system, NarL family, invasion response regulator UvrY